MNFDAKRIDWIKLVLGIWIMVSPWVLNFSGITLALWSNLIAGVFIVILCLWGLFGSAEK